MKAIPIVMLVLSVLAFTGVAVATAVTFVAVGAIAAPEAHAEGGGGPNPCFSSNPPPWCPK